MATAPSRRTSTSGMGGRGAAAGLKPGVAYLAPISARSAASGVRRGGLLAFTLLLFLALTSVASAHGNQEVGEGRSRLAPGGVVEFPVELHYHRLVGNVATVDSGDPRDAVSVSALGPSGIQHLAGPAGTLRVNALLACCKGEAWTPHVIRIENTGPRAIDVDVRLALLHDGLAVAAHDAEKGAAISLIAFAALPAGIAFAMLRIGGPPGRGGGWPAASAASHAGLWGVGGVLALVAMTRYGGGPAAGVIAMAADLPWVGNAFLTTADLLLFVLFVLWTASLAAWARTARRAHTERRVLALAMLLVLGPLCAALSWAIEYDAWPVPLLACAAATALPLAWMIPAVRSTLLPRQAEAESPEARAL